MVSIFFNLLLLLSVATHAHKLYGDSLLRSESVTEHLRKGNRLLSKHVEMQTPESDNDDSNKYTRWTCTGEKEKRSCLFENLYYDWSAGGKGSFMMYLPPDQKSDVRASDVGVFRADKYEGPYVPMTKTFEDKKSFNEFLASRHVLEQPGLSVHFNPLFHHNIGHALFDGLYPAYMALVRLGLQDENFRPVVGVDPGCFAGSGAEGDLKPGEIIQAYLPHPEYNKTLQPSKVEIVQVNGGSGSFMQSDDASAMCNFEHGLDSSAVELGAQGVSGGEAGKAQCCRACEKTWGCTAGVIFANICYMKGECPHGSCDKHVPDRLMCRFNEERRPKLSLTVRPISSSADSAALMEGSKVKTATIPGTWVVGRVRPRCMSEGIYEKFGKSNDILRLFEMDRDLRANQKILYRFDKMAIGSGGVGNLIADESGAIGGSTENMAPFRDRMLEAYGLPTESESSAGSDGEKPLNVVIVRNKRFNEGDETQIESVMKQFQAERPSSNVEFIDWGAIGNTENRFHEHLKRVQQADVYVSSIGTALQYVPFMKNHKVYVALGTVWQRDNQLFPTFMEQQLAGGGTPYLRTLYADPGAPIRNGKHDHIGQDGYRVNLNGDDLLNLLGQAETLVRQGFEVPVPIKDNLSKEGKVLLELCEQDPASCIQMNHDRNTQYDCAVILWPECVVYEVGSWRNANRCHMNRDLLRQLRKKHGLFAYGAPEM